MEPLHDFLHEHVDLISSMRSQYWAGLIGTTTTLLLVIVIRDRAKVDLTPLGYALFCFGIIGGYLAAYGSLIGSLEYSLAGYAWMLVWMFAGGRFPRRTSESNADAASTGREPPPRESPR